MSAAAGEATAGIRLRSAIRPGDLGMITYLHGVIYAAEHGLDATFEPYVARPLSAFVLAGADAGRLWIAERDGARGPETVGSIALVRDGASVGQVRWFVLVPEVRGLGLGRRMLDAALAYAGEAGLGRVYLWTFADLDAAIALYRRAGFVESERKTHHIWGATRTELRMDLTLG